MAVVDGNGKYGSGCSRHGDCGVPNLLEEHATFLWSNPRKLCVKNVLILFPTSFS